MPIKPEDVLTALDIDPSKFDDVSAFTGEFSKEWLRRGDAANDEDVRGAVFGKINAVQRQKARKVLSGLGFDDVKVDDMDPADIFPLIGEKVSAKITALQEESKKGGKGSEEAEKLKAQLAEAIKSKEDIAKLHEVQVGKYNELENAVKTREIEGKINGEWDRAIGSQKFRQGLSEFEKEGFLSRMRKDFQVKFDESGTPYAADSKGDRIPEPGKAQKFMDLPSLIATKVKEFKLDEINPHGNKPVGGQRPTASPMPTRETVPQAPGARKVHPAFGRL